MSSEKGTGTYQSIIHCNVTAKSVKTKILGLFGPLWAEFEAKRVPGFIFAALPS
jgi:hypothetical protein